MAVLTHVAQSLHHFIRAAGEVKQDQALDERGTKKQKQNKIGKKNSHSSL